jgi:uncharacterized protein involved in response to NO
MQQPMLPVAATACGERPVILFAAPHRFLFLVGIGQLTLSILWWSFALARLHPTGDMVGAVPIVLLHAPLLLYVALPPLFFGFLLTVFPRWMGYPDLTRRAYVPAGGGYAFAALASWLGLFTGGGVFLVVAFGAALLASLWGATLLLRVALRERRDGNGPTWHAWSILAAFGAAISGQIALLRFLVGLDLAQWFYATRIGLHLFLMPVFLTVCHRMLPFFAANAVQGYRPWRPIWLLGCIWVGIGAAHNRGASGNACLAGYRSRFAHPNDKPRSLEMVAKKRGACIVVGAGDRLCLDTDRLRARVSG